jgi:hypothetical protein
MKSLQRGLARRGMRIKQQQQEPLFLTEKFEIFKKISKKSDFFRKKCVYIGEGA